MPLSPLSQIPQLTLLRPQQVSGGLGPQVPPQLQVSCPNLGVLGTGEKGGTRSSAIESNDRRCPRKPVCFLSLSWQPACMGATQHCMGQSSLPFPPSHSCCSCPVGSSFPPDPQH